MRILFHWPTQLRDGPGSHTGALITALRAIGHEVKLVGGSRVVAGLSSLTPRVMPSSGDAWLDVIADNLAFSALRRAWQSFKPELMFVHAAPFHGAAARLARATRSPLFVSVAAPLAPGYQSRGNRLKKAGKDAEAALWRAADRVLVPTATLAESLHEDGVAREKLTVLRPASRLSPPPSSLPRSADSPLRLGVPQSQALSNAVAEITKGLASLGQTHHVEWVFLPDDADASAWAKADVALLPDAGELDLPPAFAAALAAGCTLLAADAKPTRAMFKHTQTALLFDAATPGFAFKSLQWLLEAPELRVLLAKAARHVAEQQSRDWPSIATEVVAMAEADIAYRRQFASSRLA